MDVKLGSLLSCSHRHHHQTIEVTATSMQIASHAPRPTRARARAHFITVSDWPKCWSRFIWLASTKNIRQPTDRQTDGRTHIDIRYEKYFLVHRRKPSEAFHLVVHILLVHWSTSELGTMETFMVMRTQQIGKLLCYLGKYFPDV